jgi:hypothetical protein
MKYIKYRLPNFIVNIQPPNRQTSAPSANQREIPATQQAKKRGRKTKAVVEGEIATSVRTEVCSIQYHCDKNHPNHHLDGNVDTCPIENIVEYESEVAKAEVSDFIFSI